jgi:ubiquinone biosynthesis protein
MTKPPEGSATQRAGRDRTNRRSGSGARHLDAVRFVRLAWVLVKYALVPLLKFPLRIPQPRVELARRLRFVLQELGGVYIKIGQYLAMRHDIVPVEFCRELDQLFENVEPLVLEVVIQVVEHELGGQIRDHFSAFKDQPIAAGSVAQVHVATTRLGAVVAVKVQRPDAERLFMADARNLRRIAVVVDFLRLLGTLSAREGMDHFIEYTKRELDFLVEGKVAERLSSGDDPYGRFPRIYWEFSTHRILTMEFVDGISVSRLCGLAAERGIEGVRRELPGFDLGVFLRRLTFSCLHQLFVTGFFHGDPHPGNILVSSGNSVWFVDFGIFGELSPDQREILASYAENLATGNVFQSFLSLSMIYEPTADSSPRRFRDETMSTLRRWYLSSQDPRLPPGESHLGKYFDAMVGVVQRNHYKLRMEYILFWRTVIILDAIALQLSPTFDLILEMRLFFQGIRPTPADQALRLITYQFERLIGPAAVRQTLTTCQGAAGALARRNRIQPLVCSNSERSDRQANRSAKAVAVGILGLSLIILANGSVTATDSRIAIIASGVALLAISPLILRTSWSPISDVASGSGSPSDRQRPTNFPKST